MNGRTIKFVGLSNRRTIELSDYRTVGLSNRRTIELGLSDYRTVGLSNRRTIKPSDYRSVPNQTVNTELKDRQYCDNRQKKQERNKQRSSKHYKK